LSSTRPDGSRAFERELLLSTLTLDWATGTIITSLLPHWSYRHNPDAAVPADDPSRVPTAVSIFGGEWVPFPKPPRELAQRYYTLTHGPSTRLADISHLSPSPSYCANAAGCIPRRTIAAPLPARARRQGPARPSSATASRQSRDAPRRRRSGRGARSAGVALWH
jgi:hypothetical protein